MKKKILSLLLSVVMILTIVTSVPLGSVAEGYKANSGLYSTEANEFAVGAVTLTEPAQVNSVYQIGTVGELYWFAALVNGTDGLSQNIAACAVLTCDISVNSNVLNSDGTLNGTPAILWTPIASNGTFNLKYTGSFDGQNHTISGLYYNDSNVSYIGLFGYNNGAVKNVSVTDSYFCGKQYVGGICGENLNNSVENCNNSGTVKSDSYVGGIIGGNYLNGSVINCKNTGTVIGGSSYYTGGICGLNSLGTISYCINSGSVSSGSDSVGGICGNNSATITNCGNVGAVSGSDSVGGICGVNNKTIENCTNSSTVKATASFSSYGGLCGRNSGAINNCYYNKELFTELGTGGYTHAECGRTDEVYNSGEVAWLLNTSGKDVSDDGYTHTGVWSQGENGPVLADSENLAIYRLVLKTDDGLFTKAYYLEPGDSIVMPTATVAASGVVIPETMPASDATYIVKSANYCARVRHGSTSEDCYDFSVAWAKALECNEAVTITLLDECETSDELVLDKSTANITLNLNSFKLSLKFDAMGGYAGAIKLYSGSLTINGNGQITESKAYDLFNCNGGSLTIENGLFKSSNIALHYYSGTVSLRGGTFEASDFAISCSEGISASSTLADGCTFYDNDGVLVDGSQQYITETVTVKEKAPFSITKQPTAPSSIIFGETTAVTMTVETDITDGVNYQWYDNDVEINGATASSYIIPENLSAGEHSFVCKMTKGTYTVSTNPIYIKVVLEAPECVNGVYKIKTANDILWFAALVNGDTTLTNGVAQNMNANAILENNINLNPGYTFNADGSYSGGNSPLVWMPIGYVNSYEDKSQYSGTFDGNGKTVSGVYTNPNKSYQGFFGYVFSGTVKNLTIDGNVAGTEEVGGICGCNNGIITGCVNNAVVSGTSYVGGVCGYGMNYSIKNCINNGTVNGDRYVGGICGSVDKASITGCINTATVTGTSIVGSICGSVNTRGGGNLKFCYYLDTDETDSFDGSTFKTAEQFRSGEVAALLQESCSEITWGQGDSDLFPVLTSDENLAKKRAIFNYNGTTTTQIFKYNDKLTFPKPETEDGSAVLYWVKADGTPYRVSEGFTSGLELTAVMSYTKLVIVTASVLSADRTNNTVSSEAVKNGRTVKTYKDNFKNDNNLIVIETADGVVLSDNDLVGTGCVIKSISELDGVTVLDSLMVIVMGDVNGDGLLDDNDYTLLKSNALTCTLEGAFFTAADVYKDGAIDGFDLYLMNLSKNSIEGKLKYTVTQQQTLTQLKEHFGEDITVYSADGNVVTDSTMLLSTGVKVEYQRNGITLLQIIEVVG